MEKRKEKLYLNQLKQGNINSFRLLYLHYHERVYRFCLSFTKSPQDAEEITADVFVRIWEKRAIIDPGQTLQPLLFKITKDLTWNYLKRVSRKENLKQVFFQNYFQTTHNSTEEDFLFGEYMEILDQAVSELTPQQRKVFTLRYLRGKELNQIARELSISRNTVKVHLANSKRLVMNYLKVHADICWVVVTTLFCLFY